MKILLSVLSLVATFFLFYALGRRRARAAARRAAYAERQREFARLSRLRGFRRGFLRQVAMRQINAHPTQRHLPRRVRRSMARHAGNAAFRRERGLPTPASESHWRRAMRVAYNLLRAPVPAAGGAAAAA